MFQDIAPRDLGQHYRDVRRRLNTPNPTIAALEAAQAALAGLRVKFSKLQSERDFLADKLKTVSADLENASRARAQQRAETMLRRLENRILVGKKVKQLQDIVCAKFHMTIAELCQSNAKQRYAHPRHIAFYVCRLHLNMSLEKVGQAFGGRDHTTIRSAVLGLTKTMAADQKTKDEVESVLAALNGATE